MKNGKRIIEHVLFWILYWLFMSLSGGLYDYDFANTALFHLLQLPLTIIGTYLFVYRILPLYFARKTAAFLVGSVLAFAVLSLSGRLLMKYVLFPLLYADSDYTFTFFDWYRMAGNLVRLCGVIGVVAGFRYYRVWKRAREKVEELSEEKKEAELSFLKAQLHPHFLFNTLNSIYFEAVKKSDKAPDLIIRLSEMLRFTLHECKDKFIPIATEIQLIENYISLEQSRYGSRLGVVFAAEGDQTRMIPPLICFSLVENAFKHGASEAMGESQIEILFQEKPSMLMLTVKNPVASDKKADDWGASNGIGLANVTRQLDLIFGKDYQLQCEQMGGVFVSTLEMPLN